MSNFVKLHIDMSNIFASSPLRVLFVHAQTKILGRLSLYLFSTDVDTDTIICGPAILSIVQ